MSDCSNSRCEPYRRAEVLIVFTDSRELCYRLPLNLMDREIDHFEADGARYLRQRIRDWDDLDES